MERSFVKIFHFSLLRQNRERLRDLCECCACGSCATHDAVVRPLCLTGSNGSGGAVAVLQGIRDIPYLLFGRSQNRARTVSTVTQSQKE